MAESLIGSTASAFKHGMYDAAVAAINDPAVHVSFGLPDVFVDDMVTIGRVTSGQEPITMGTNRSREETLTIELTFSCVRGGGEAAELVTSDRAYDLLGRVEYYCRITNTTLGGVVRQVTLTAHEAQGGSDPNYGAANRVTEIVATFSAQARIGRY